MVIARNILVTGIPRSGTTLAGALLDTLPDTVCLSEPPWHWHKATGGVLDIGRDPDGMQFAKWLVGDFVAIRRKLAAGEQVLDRRAPDDRAITNYHRADRSAASGVVSETGMRPFARSGLSQDFTLAIKHNGPYLTALGPLLDLGWFTVVGIVRHPVEVIHSWRALNLPVSHGKMHDAARCWPEMEAATAEGPVLERQVRIYDLICARLFHYRDRLHLLRYEDLRADPQLLARAVGAEASVRADVLDAPSREVPDAERALIVRALEAQAHHYRALYPDL